MPSCKGDIPGPSLELLQGIVHPEGGLEGRLVGPCIAGEQRLTVAHDEPGPPFEDAPVVASGADGVLVFGLPRRLEPYELVIEVIHRGNERGQNA